MKTALSALVLSVAMLPLGASALDFTPDPSRVLSDPLFLPYAHQLYGDTLYQYGRTTGDVSNVNSTPNKSFTTSASTLGQILEYGIANRLTLTMSDSYVWRKTADDLANGRTSSSNASGFTDPSFGLIWRMLDQRTKPLNLDISFSYAPNWVEAHTASVTTDGSVATGGSATNIGMALGYKMQDFTVRGALTAEHFSNRNILNITNNQTSETSSVWDYQLALSTQTRLNNLFSVNLGIGENLNNSYGTTNQTTLATSTSRPGDVTNLNAGLNVNIIPNRLVFGLTYQYNIYGDGLTQFTNPANNTSTTSESENIFGMKLQYVFF